MCLIHAYDQDSKGSTSGDDMSFTQRNTVPSTSFSHDSETPPNNKVNNFEPIERIPIDRLMMATAAIAEQKPTTDKPKQTLPGPSIWIADIENELRMCLGNIQVLQKHTILESMDHFISKLKKDYSKLSKPNTADVLLRYVRAYLHIYKFLFRNMEKGNRYYKRFIKLLSIYTDLELSASIRGTEYNSTVAERIVLNYQSYLDSWDNSMILDVLLNAKRLWRPHRGILALVFEYFLVRKRPIELPDVQFMKHLIIFKKWLHIERPDDQRKVRDAFVEFVKPMKTLCMNSLFKPYLPVDAEGFVTIANTGDILDKEYPLSPLVRSLKKVEIHLEPHEESEVIVLTDGDDDDDEHNEDEDDEDDDDAAFSSTYSNYGEHNEFDWHLTSSQLDHQYAQSQDYIETVSVDSPPPLPPTKCERLSSNSSVDSCDLDFNALHSPPMERNDRVMGELQKHSRSPTPTEEKQEVVEQQQQQQKQKSPLTVTVTETVSADKPIAETNGENNETLSTLDESMFNRLVNDINSTHLSVPDNGNLSSDSKAGENVTSTATEMETEEATVESALQLVDGDKMVNGEVAINSDQAPSISDHIDKHVEVESNDGSPLKNHEDTLRNIEEIVIDDLNKQSSPPTPSSAPNECDTNNGRAASDTNVVNTIVQNDIEMEIDHSETANNASASDLDATPPNFVPMAESTASIIETETSLLTKSEQDILFKDRDASLILTDLWANRPSTTIANESPSKIVHRTKSPHSLNNSPSPKTFRANDIDSMMRLKTYTRRRPVPIVETKSISTQTSQCPSPVTTMIDESDSSKLDKHLITEKTDDEWFLRDIFSTPPDDPSPALRTRSTLRMQSPLHLGSAPVVASTPIVSTTPQPIASTSHTENESTLDQTTMDASTIGSAEVPVKRKRGRPRKYPLLEPGTTPVKPPKAPRQPRKPRTPKTIDPNDSSDVEVFERMQLRPRRPKPQPPPPPPAPVTPKRRRGRPRKTLTPEQIKIQEQNARRERKERKARRNTIKMTIDAILNTQSSNFTAIQARRISHILGFPISSPQLATILKRRNYNKSVNSSNNESGTVSMLQTFQNRSNGQMNNTAPIAQTAGNNTTTTTTPSTILARKTYIKPNLTLSSLSSALRRISYGSRRVSYSTRRISFSSSVPRIPNVRTVPAQRNRTNKQQSTLAQQRYTKVDIFDTATKSKRGRKKGTKDSVPRKKKSTKTTTPLPVHQHKFVTPNKTATNFSTTVKVSPEKNSTVEIDGKTLIIELVDLTKELAPYELDASNEMNDQFDNIDAALSSTQQQSYHTDSSGASLTMKSCEQLNEIEMSGLDSTLDDVDDSRTRKSNRSRKRPKILDL